MNKIKLLLGICLLSLLIISNLSAKSKIRFYGSYESIFDSKQKTNYYSKKYSAYSWGWNNYANLRLKANIGDYLEFGMAMNINMFSGNYTQTYSAYASSAQGLLTASFYGNPYTQEAADPSLLNLAGSNFFSLPFFYKNTYIGSFDLERLYLKGGNNYFSIETGLIRIARGYGYSFSPTDFFNPKDPLNPNARPEGKLAILSTFYPLDMWKIEIFAVAPDNPIIQEAWGFKFGTATKFSVKRFDFEFLYTLFIPEIEYEKDPIELNMPEYTNNDFSHIIGFSLKADIEIGLFIDMIYRIDHKSLKTREYYGESFYAYKGLEAALGIDYTVSIPQTHASVYFLLEYMFYGSGMIDWSKKNINDIYTDEWNTTAPEDRYSLYNTEKKLQTFLRHDYLFGMIKFTLNTYVNVGTSYLFGIDDQSALLSLLIDIEPFQAFTLNFTATYPLGWESVDSAYERGEFGPTNVGYYQDYKITAKVKF